MKKRICMGLIALFLLSGCAEQSTVAHETATPLSPAATVTLTATPEPTETGLFPTQISYPPTTTPIPVPVIGTVVASDGLVYNVIYRQDNFEVREAYIGEEAEVFRDFKMPILRITDAIPDLRLDMDWYGCDAQFEVLGRCADTREHIASDGRRMIYTLSKDHVLMGGHYVLQINGLIAWERDLLSPIERTVLTSKWIGDELAFDFGTKTDDLYGYIYSIILTQGDHAIDVSEVYGYAETFGPNYLLGKFAFFGAVYSPGNYDEFLVFDGERVAYYDSVFNMHCCWDGPGIWIIGNGRILDFFAQRNGSWYHVQAGDFSSIHP